MALSTNSISQVLAKTTRLLAAWTLIQGLALQLCHAQPATSISTITSAESIVTNTDVPPAATAAWTPIALPWFQSFRDNSGEPAYVWMRFSVPAPASTEKLGLLITRHMRNLTIHVNGQLLHSERLDPARDYLGWNTPLLVELQTATLSQPRNEIVLGLYQSIGSSYLNAPMIGPYSQIEPLYRDSYFLQVQVALIACIACMVLGMLALGLWAIRRQHLEYLYFGASGISWALVMLFMYLPSPLLMNLKSWIVLSYFNTNFAGLAFIAFIARVLRFRAQAWLKLGLALLGLCCVLILLLPARSGILLAVPLHGATMFALLVTGMLTLVQYRRVHSTNARWMALSLLAMLVLPAFDMVRFFNAFRTGAGFSSPTLTQFSFPFSLAILFVHIIYQYWHALRASERLNQELVVRVHAATTELEQHLNLRHQQELQESTEQQRRRIYRDLHDDVGAKLTSILHSADTGKQKQMARAALESLRETVHHANYQQQTLQDLINTACEEMQLRLQAAGLQFVPPAQTLSSDRGLSSQESYHLTRALREITSNILTHAHATTVQLHARDEGSAGFLLEIQDDGRGFLPGGAGGNGLSNIALRLQELQGRAEWHSSAGKGCKVQLWLPAEPVEAMLVTG
jgi:signal transduction histidine kinase